MAAGDSPVSICNGALIALGEDLITSLNDNTKRAILCLARYDVVRRRVLRDHPWHCAKTRVNLAADVNPPAFGYNFSYTLPADCLRVLDLPENDMAEWKVEAGKLLTDEIPPLSVLYIRDLSDCTMFDAGLVQYLERERAVELAEPLTQSPDKEQRMAQKAEQVRSDVELDNAQEGSSQEWDEDVLLRSRR